VLLPEDLYRQVAHAVDAKPLHAIHVKGRAAEVRVYELVGSRAR